MRRRKNEVPVLLPRVYYPTILKALGCQLRRSHPITRVRVAELKAVQPFVEVDRVQYYALRKNKKKTEQPVIVLLTPKGMLLWNGHHRVHACILRGCTWINARVYDVREHFNA